MLGMKPMKIGSSQTLCGIGGRWNKVERQPEKDLVKLYDCIKNNAESFGLS